MFNKITALKKPTATAQHFILTIPFQLKFNQEKKKFPSFILIPMKRKFFFFDRIRCHLLYLCSLPNKKIDPQNKRRKRQRCMERHSLRNLI